MPIPSIRIVTKTDPNALFPEVTYYIGAELIGRVIEREITDGFAATAWYYPQRRLDPTAPQQGVNSYQAGKDWIIRQWQKDARHR